MWPSATTTTWPDEGVGVGDDPEGSFGSVDLLVESRNILSKLVLLLWTKNSKIRRVVTIAPLIVNRVQRDMISRCSGAGRQVPGELIRGGSWGGGIEGG